MAFTSPITLDPDHYFFVPQVELDSGNFLWLSAPRPIVPPGTAFPLGFTDLQTWIRDEALQPDWLRVGTDIVGGATPPTFNAAFSLSGVAVPGPVAGAGLPGLPRVIGEVKVTENTTSCPLTGPSPWWRRRQMYTTGLDAVLRREIAHISSGDAQRSRRLIAAEELHVGWRVYSGRYIRHSHRIRVGGKNAIYLNDYIPYIGYGSSSCEQAGESGRSD